MVASAVALASCGRTASQHGAPAQTADRLIDPALPRAVLRQPGWGYGRVAARDLDNDGVEEQVVVIADAALHEGKLLWEDGHVWQIYIEEPDGARTYVYSRLVPMGHVHARFTAAPQPGPPALILLEQAPHHLGVYEVRYRGPHRVSVTEWVDRQLQPGPSSGSPEP
jgi:hypothetical protein